MGIVVVTGAAGFIGKAVVQRCAEQNREVRAVVRRNTECLSGMASVVAAGDLGERQAYDEILRGAEVVVHLAARAHRLDLNAREVLEAYRRVNLTATLRLAQAAARMGTRRFIFLSSIGVLGERTHHLPFQAFHAPHPIAPYAISKAEAEDALRTLSRRTGLEVVIIRPPLVCGPGAPGNLRRLLRLAATPWPLPLGAVRNRRTLIGLTNLVSLIAVTLDHPSAPGDPLLAGDDAAVSTAELVTWIRRTWGRPPRLVAVPIMPMRTAARWVGLDVPFEKLTGSLEIDNSITKQRLGWQPRVPTAESVADMARSYMESVRLL